MTHTHQGIILPEHFFFFNLFILRIEPPLQINIDFFFVSNKYTSENIQLKLLIFTSSTNEIKTKHVKPIFFQLFPRKNWF